MDRHRLSRVYSFEQLGNPVGMHQPVDPAPNTSLLPTRQRGALIGITQLLTKTRRHTSV